jgi:Transposase and inactivated derivatives, IS1 family
MWSNMANPKKANNATNALIGKVLAYGLAPHTDAALESLMQLFAPFGIERFYTDGWGGYTRLLDKNQHEVGKQYRQKIKRKHLTLGTRIKRQARNNDLFFEI